MKKKDRYIKATVLMEVEFFIDKDTVPEDVFDDMVVDSDHGHIFGKKIIYTVITKKEKVK
jgi:hypothetical protein